jgi:hypothetical protein
VKKIANAVAPVVQSLLAPVVNQITAIVGDAASCITHPRLGTCLSAAAAVLPFLIGGGEAAALTDGEAAALTDTTTAAAAEEGTTADIVLSGHGSYNLVNGRFTSPDGTWVATYVPHDDYLLDSDGNQIELGNPPAPTHVYGPGEEMPNYTLHPPNGITIMGNPDTVITVEEDTLLEELLYPDMGMVHWAACTKEKSC